MAKVTITDIEEDDYYLEDITAQQLLKVGSRLCEKHELCVNCPIREFYHDCTLRFDTVRTPKKLISTIAYWGRHNPEKTNRDKFFETFGNLSYEDRKLIMSDEFGFQKWLEKEYKKPDYTDLREEDFDE